MSPVKLNQEWKTIAKDGLPDPNEYDRVLVYTEGVDFAGQQFFDVDASQLDPAGYEHSDERPEECVMATHWKPLPYPIA